MDITNRNRIIFVIILTVVAGMLFLQRPKHRKSPGYESSLSSNTKGNVTSDANTPSSQVAEANSETSSCKVTSVAPSDTLKPQEISPAGKDASDNNSKNSTFLNSLALPLPSRSLLSAEEQAKAISAFDSQRNSWLSVKNGSAKYKTSLRILKDGKFVDAPASYTQTGKFEFTVAPLDRKPKNESLASIHIRLSNDKEKWTLIKDNAFGRDSLRWTDGDNTAVKINKKDQVNASFDMELLFFPVHFMAETYSEGVWNGTGMPKEYFFKDRGLPVRQTTQEEANSKFGGESQYLFLPAPEMPTAQYWFSAEKGELRQLNVTSSADNMVKSFRYEDYIQKNGEIAKFPRKFVMTCIKGTGDKAMGWEQTVELTDLELNTNISPERFIPPVVKN